MDLTEDQAAALRVVAELADAKVGSSVGIAGVPVTARSIAERLGWDIVKTTGVLWELKSLGLVGRGAPN